MLKLLHLLNAHYKLNYQWNIIDTKSGYKTNLIVGLENRDVINYYVSFKAETISVWIK